MKPILDSDFVYMAGYTGAVTIFENLNPVVVFFGGIITCFVGLLKIIKMIKDWNK